MMYALAIFLGIIIGGFSACVFGALASSGRISHEEEYGAPEGDVTRIREIA